MTSTQIATALVGLVEGLAIRTAVDPDAVESDFVAQLALNTIFSHTQPVARE